MAVDTSYAAKDGSKTEPSFTFLDDTDTGFYRDSAGALCATINGVKAIGITSTGITPQDIPAATVLLAQDTQVLTASMSGSVLVAVESAQFTLPAASAMPGGQFTIITGVVSAAAGVGIVRAGSDTINAKTTSAGTTAITGATTITNTHTSDVVWDRMTLVSDGVSKWYAVAQSGVWA